MIAGLGAVLDLAEAAVHGAGRLSNGLREELRGHEVTAAAGGEVSAVLHELEALHVDLAVTADGGLRRLAGLRKRRRVEDDDVILLALCVQLRQLIEHIRHTEMHGVLEVVPLRIRRRLLDRKLRDIEALDLRRACNAGVQREGTHVREAVEDALPLADSLHRPTVILLVEEKSGLLSIHHVDHILDTVLGDLDIRIEFRADEALIHVHAFLFPNRRVAPLVNAADVDAVFPEDCHEILENHRLQTIHAERERLHHQHILIFIDRQSRQSVGLAEDHTAGIRVLAHDGLPVFPRRLHTIAQKCRVDRLLPPAAQHPHTDL